MRHAVSTDKSKKMLNTVGQGKATRVVMVRLNEISDSRSKVFEMKCFRRLFRIFYSEKKDKFVRSLGGNPGTAARRRRTAKTFASCISLGVTPCPRQTPPP